ncbi:MAG: transglycosylase SLT domain-containing protein [Xanthobacteraceae bacterium]
MQAGAISASGSGITGAIRQAAQLTGANFQYLLATAQVESNFNPNATAPTSSAGGLFQFIEQTWLSTLKQSGAAFGYGQYANAITQTASGRYVVADPRARSTIMQLRNDPTANSVMAGVFTRQNTAKLAARIGRDPSEGELYIAHFLGAGGAGKLIDAAGTNPAAPAASLFPFPARANPTIFYDKLGRQRSVSQVYSLLVGKYQTARAGVPTTAPATATASGTAGVTAAAADTAGVTNAFAAAVAGPTHLAAGDGPIFHTLFQTGERREPFAPLVSQLWAPPPQSAAPPASAPAPSATSENRSGPAPGPSDTQSRDPRGLFGAGGG